MYNSVANRIAVIDEAGNRWSYYRDSHGPRRSGESPLGYRRSTLYDARGRSAEIDARPHASRSRGTLTAPGRAAPTNWAIRKHGFTTVPANENVAAVDALGYATSFYFDGAARPLPAEDTLGYRSTNVLDGAGRTVATIDALGNRVSRTWDGDNRPVDREDPLDTRTTTVWDGNRPGHRHDRREWQPLHDPVRFGGPAGGAVDALNDWTRVSSGNFGSPAFLVISG